MPTLTPTFREQRLRQGWTLRDLVEQCATKGVSTSESALSRIEHGAVPRPNLRVVLAQLLDVDVTDFERKAS